MSASMVRAAIAALSLALLAAPAAAAEKGEPNGRPSFAVLPLELPEPLRDRRDAFVTIVAARLERAGGRVITRSDLSAMLGFEQERAKLAGGCGEGCAAELSGALGVRYVVNGQVASLGDEWLVALALYDRGTVRRHAERVKGPEEFAAALERGADALAALVSEDLAPAAAAPGPAPARGEVSVAAGGSPQIAKLKLEYGYPLLPELWLVVQGSLFLSWGEVSAVPAGAGVKWVFGPEHRVRPYVSLLAGVAVADRSASFHAIGTAGLEVLVWRRLGLLLEASADSSSVQRSPEGHTVFSATANAGLSYTW
jgi:hypothetical protein